METALNELTLVLFTTIAPAGVIGYLTMAVVIMRSQMQLTAVPGGQCSQRANTIGHYLVIPLVLTISGFIASATHLGTPANALYVLTGVGRSPLSNEVVAAVAFLALGGIYWIVSFRDDLTRPFQLIWLGATIVAGLVAVGFISVAYSVSSVPTWNLPTAPITLWLNALSSGPLVGLLGLVLARQEPTRGEAVTILVVAMCAAIANALVIALEWQVLEGIVTTTTRAVDLVPATPVIVGVYITLECAAVVLCGLGTMRKGRGAGVDPFVAARRARATRSVLVVVGCLLALAACFAVRFVFYSMHMTVGV